MTVVKQSWGKRFRDSLNDLMDRVAEFEMEGGLSAAVARSVERLKQEQERIRQEMGHQGPLTYHARIRQAYARLELPYGAGKEQVRKAYRRLMRLYHPDRHTTDPQRERIATEVAQKLTAAHDLLLEYLD